MSEGKKDNGHRGKREIQSFAHNRKAGDNNFKRKNTNRHKRRKIRWMYKEQLRSRSEYVYFE